MKISLTDLTGTESPPETTTADIIAEEIDDALQNKQKTSKNTIQFLDTNPLNSLERVLLKKELKNAVSSKNMREKLLKIRFDAKMQRIKKIKSKKYKKQKRRLEAKKVLEQKLNVEESSDDNSDSDELAFDNEKDNVQKILSIIGQDGYETNKRTSQNIEKTDENISEEKISEEENIPEDFNTNQKKQNDSAFVRNLLNRKQEPSKTINTHVFNFQGDNKAIQTDLVKSLFQDIPDNENDFDNDFYESKKEKLEKILQTEDEEIVLQGWGQWGGTGIQTVKTKHNTIILKAQEHCIDEKELVNKHVIINKPVPAPEKYKSDVPRHITTEAYLKRMRVPVSREMNSAQLFLRYVRNKDAGPDEFYEYASKHKQ